MPWELLQITQRLPEFFLILARVSGLWMSAPFFNSPAIPTRARIGMMTGTAAILFPLLHRSMPKDIDLGTAIGGLFGELMIGLAMGLALNVIVSGALMAGSLIGQQAGFNLGQVYNPLLEDESSVLGEVYFMMMMSVVLLCGAHRSLMEALLQSFAFIPPLSRFDLESIPILLTDLLSAAFVLGLKLSGPGLIAFLLLELAMGILSKAMPQLNILTVGFSIRSLMAMGIVAVSLTVGGDLMAESVSRGMDHIRMYFNVAHAE